MADLKINGTDAKSYGVKMGDGFIDALLAPASVKDYITNDSRIEHGIRVAGSTVKLASREVTLTFNIEGTSKTDYEAKRKAFYNILYAGNVTVQVPDISNDIYHLKYLGKSISFARSPSGKFSKLSVKFLEPNPADRS